MIVTYGWDAKIRIHTWVIYKRKYGDLVVFRCIEIVLSNLIGKFDI